MIFNLTEDLARRFSKNGIGFLAAFFFLLRIALNYKSPDLISTPDELYQGYIATEWLQGLRANLFHYQGDPYTAGSLVVGTLAAPFFFLLGKSLFALKCVPILFSAAAFWGTLHLLQKQFNPAAALAAGGLILFSPPSYTALSLMALGSHPESILMSVLILAALYAYIQSPSAPRAFLFGLSGGVACWFAHINIIMDFLCAGLFLYFLIKRRLPLSHITFKVLGALAGFSPWFFYNQSHEWQGLEFINGTITHSSMEALRFLPASFGNLILIHFPQSLFFKQTFVTVLYSLCLLAGYVIFLSGIKTKNEMPAEKKVFLYFYAVFPVVFLFAFSYFQPAFSWHHEMTPFRFRYFAPFFYFLVIPAAIAAFNSPKLRLFYFLMFFSGIWGQIQLFTAPALLPGTQRPGYFLENPHRVFDLARGYEKVKSPFPDWSDFSSFAAAETSIKKEPVSFQPVYEMALGAALFNWNSVTARPEMVFSDFDLRDPELSPWIIRGIGHSLLWTLESPAMLEKAVQQLHADVHILNGIYWGLGWRLKEYEGDADLISKYPEEILKPMRNGFDSYFPQK